MPKKRLDVLLTERGLAPSLEKSRAEIMAGNVLVNDAPAVKAGSLFEENTDIRLKDQFPYVGRGAIKLIHALDHFHIGIQDKVAVDIGSSTGGFTEVLLERGAKKVYCVDSGTNQLDWKLRSDKRVTVMENTNARYLQPDLFDPRPSLATVDVSFISLKYILGPLSNVMQRPFTAVVLIKPQFELEKSRVGEKGLVSPEYRSEAVESVLRFAESIGLKTFEVIESPIVGARSGNVEYLTVLEGNP